MLTRRLRLQLTVFTIVTMLAMSVLGWHYLRLPSVVGMGQYSLEVDLPTSGGLYPTANVTYRGITVGKVTGRADRTRSSGHIAYQRPVQNPN